MDNVMKENTNNKTTKINDSAKESKDSQTKIDFSQDADVQAAVKRYRREDGQRKVALILSLMGNIMFLVTAYTILCYDTTGRLFGRLLGINL